MCPDWVEYSELLSNFENCAMVVFGLKSPIFQIIVLLVLSQFCV